MYVSWFKCVKIWTQGVHRITLIRQSHTAFWHKKHLNDVRCEWCYYSSWHSQHFRTRFFHSFPGLWSSMDFSLVLFYIFWLLIIFSSLLAIHSVNLTKCFYYLFSVRVCVGVYTCSGTRVLPEDNMWDSVPAFHCENSRNQKRSSGSVPSTFTCWAFLLLRPFSTSLLEVEYFLVICKSSIYTLEHVNLCVCISDVLSKVVA